MIGEIGLKFDLNNFKFRKSPFKILSLLQDYMRHGS